ncbi:2-hydroxyacyl-CoA dehydratase [Amycolatopsis pigmentata]|uniref:2-hydroxyacyl-CoA dehydratase n=1 Tax=Amycolatopsis pigmentata TaxID=450801 RepID=A0ABW5FJH3_9PSEU
MMSAFDRLTALYEARTGPVPAALDDRPTVAYVGADVPVEVLSACGFVPFRFPGRAGAHEAAARYCGPGIDGAAVSLLARLLEGEAAEAAGLVLSADCEGTVRLFLYLREIQRLERRPGVPRFTFTDLVHLPQRTSAVYNRTRLDAFVTEMGEWAGRPVSDDGLRDAVAEHDRVRALIRAVGTELRTAPGGPRLTGADALAVIGAAFLTSPRIWCELAGQLLDEAGKLPRREGVRVFLTGCGHDSPRAYEVIESLGAVIVGEDHDWGALAGERVVGRSSDLRAALVRSRARDAPASAGHAAATRAGQTVRMAVACGADLVIAWTRQNDDAPAWDVPMQRRALEGKGIPLVAVPAQAYGADGDDEAIRILTEALRGRVAEVSR